MNPTKGRLLLIAIALASFASVCLCEDDDSDEAVVTEEVDDAIEDILYSSPTPSGNVYLAEHFDNVERFRQKWVKSEAKKDDMDEEIAKYEGEWSVEPPSQDGLKGDQGLVLKSKAKHSAIAARLDRPFVFLDKPLVVQYEVSFQEGQDCGGAYLKLLSQGKQATDYKKFNDKTPYTIMFGPDKCGTDAKLHFIFRHRNPLNGTLSEKHCKKSKDKLEEPYKDKRPHLYALHVFPDNSFKIYLDQKVINEGSLLDDFTPSVNPPAEIEDPNDKKPADWDEREKIPDPEAKKPDDWDEDAPPMIPDESASMPDGWLDDEPEMIPDPKAEKPDDWDTEMDGEWEAPLITNPVCEGAPGCGPWKRPMINNPDHKGKWRPPLIDNPNYKGKWKPRQIPNPDFFEDLHPFKMTSIEGLGFELWSMSNMILFDNVIVTDDPEVADRWASETYKLKIMKINKDSAGIVMKLVQYTNDHPWLWAVYVIVIGLPIVMFFVFCCGGSSQEKAEMKRAAEAKKTDAISPDDEEEEDEDVDETTALRPKTTKSDLEVPEGEDLTKAEGDRASDGEGEHLEEEEEEEEEEEPVQDAVPEGAGDAPRSPKKVRSRKE